MKITIGIDIGQKVDPTSITVTEEIWRPPPRDLPGLKAYEDHHLVRHMETLPLGTPYPRVVERLTDIAKAVEERVRAGNLENRAGWLEPTDVAVMKVYIDATGVGLPIVDMMKAAGVAVTGVFFTHGDRRQEKPDELTGELIVVLGKAYMVARLQALLQTNRIHLPRTAEAEALVRELLDYEIKVDQNANDKYGAFRVGAHDDMVTSLGLTVNKPPRLIGAASSTPGHKAMQVPSWAGGAADQGRLSSLPQSAGLPAFGGLTQWDSITGAK